MIIKIKNVDVNYERYGDKNKQPVVFLHGWGQNIQMMKALGDARKEENDVLIIDLPGHGKSSEPEYAWNLFDFIEFLKELLEKFFREKFGKKVDIIMAKQGVKRQLLEMAQNNASDYLSKSIDKIKHKNDMTKNACQRLKEILGLNKYPKRMECYDISNISGVDKVGSMVVFIDGEADKSSYRRFKIKTVEGANDYASHQEMMRRRLAKLGTDEEERFPKPDLIIIDGGKGQLSAIKEIFDEAGIEDIELIALAEREEEVFTLWQGESIRIDHRDYALKMLQRIRDEAHRFAITYFRSLHSKRNLASVLQEIEGIGQKKRLALMEKFGTIDKIMNATVEELMQADGIGEELAKKIYIYFKEKI